jgi:hypothetical protein
VSLGASPFGVRFSRTTQTTRDLFGARIRAAGVIVEDPRVLSVEGRITSRLFGAVR